MRLNKKNVEDIVNRLYSTEENGKKVIRRDRLNELIAVIGTQFSNVGTSIERYFDTEKLVVTSVTRKGAKVIFERPIEKTTDDGESGNSSHTKVIDTTWHIEECISIFKKAIEEYGYDIFENRKRAGALCGDLFAIYPDECRIFKLLFREGIYECISPLPYKSEQDIKKAQLRLEYFLERLGMSGNTRKSIITILITSFRQDETKKNITPEKNAPGTIFYIGEMNQPGHELGLFQINISKKPGAGLFKSKTIKRYALLMNKAIDGFQYLRKKQSLQEKHSILWDYDYDVECIPMLTDTLPNEITLAFILGVCSSALNKATIPGTLLVGDCDEEGNLKACRNLEKALELARLNHFKNILIPIINASDLEKLDEKRELKCRAYHSVQDVEKLALFT